MFNVHPPLASFPFVLCSVVVVAELLSLWTKSATIRHYAGISLIFCICVTPLTYLSGYLAVENADKTFQVSPDIIEAHRTLARMFLISLVPIGLLKIISERRIEKPSLRYLYLGVLIAAYGVVGLTSFRGGELIFSHGAGVEAQLTR